MKAGRDAGRISASAVLNAGEARAEAQMGREAYLARLNGNEVYFAPGMYDKVTRRPNVLKDIVKAMERQPGVAQVYTADELGNGGTSSDAQLRAAALSYVPGRSGDLVISPKPGWMFAGNGTTHGSASPDDQRVPILLYGFGIKPGRLRRRSDSGRHRTDPCVDCGSDAAQRGRQPLEGRAALTNTTLA